MFLVINFTCVRFQDDVLYNQDPQPIDFYDYANMLNQDGAPYGSLQDNLYEAYQEAIEEGKKCKTKRVAQALLLTFDFIGIRYKGASPTIM